MQSPIPHADTMCCRLCSELTEMFYCAFTKYVEARSFGQLRCLVLLVFFTICTLIPARGQETTINIDTPVQNQTYSGTQVFGGWAVDSGSRIASVVVLMDGVAPGIVAPYYGNRQDVCNIYVDYPDCPNVGWSYSVDTTQLTNGWHYIRVLANTVDGRQSTQDSTFYVENANASTINIDAPGYGANYSGSIPFSGWAVDNTATISAVKVFIDGSFVGTAATGWYRPDVCSSVGNYPGCPYVGWGIGVDTTHLSDGNHEFTVTTITNDGRATTASVLYFVTQNAQTTLINIDNPQYLMRYWNTNIIGGWAMDSTSPLSSVNISIDGIPFGTAALGSRQDACNAIGNWPGCPNVGWDYALDTTQLTDGTHEIAVTAIMANGKQTTQTQPFIVENSPSVDSEALATSTSGSSTPPINCNRSDQNLSSRAMTGSPQSDGLIHITYSVDSTDSSITSPILSAIKAWNDVKSQTGVELDPPAPGQHVDLPIGFNSVADTGQYCALYEPNKIAIFYGKTWQSSDAKTTIIEHELGHYLGLDDTFNNHPLVPTIMNNPSNSWPSNCTSPDVYSKSITAFDPPETAVCRSVTQTYASLISNRQKQITATKNALQFTVSDPYPSPGAPGTTVCTYTYETVDFYVDGEYDSSEDYVVGVNCN